ncbi:MAG TPA: sigma factor, partial [Verrucomicrobiae bacterium]|nr:sigma factor [Verrucomicrobiae bacterium]
MNTDPATLLREFLATRSEAAFSALVRSQIDLVYSAARRICSGDTHLAEDITQTVFADLARKAARLPGDIVLSAWLYRHTFFVAS